MKLRTDTVGHFENPNEKNIRDAVVYSNEGGHEGDIVKLMIDDENFISIWVGKRSVGHCMTIRTGEWKLDSVEKFTSEEVVNLMLLYLNGDLSRLKNCQWKRPIDKVLLDNIERFRNITSSS